eukprot:CAMPEP_0184383470 /NCGR_PEP_ID=MMETSP0007-20130409/7168_1 /TAXON_ID=97485 /ORGANISM="Prymnesium parvum, Strain Texoma1" /LENGTH=77 /DNA_ID=CAMNT_0026729965 /DNA_START=34 /DNA_END=264 /DNA_ORIENTATION=+
MAERQPPDPGSSEPDPIRPLIQWDDDLPRPTKPRLVALATAHPPSPNHRPHTTSPLRRQVVVLVERRAFARHLAVER